MARRDFDLVVFGATGYTGSLVAKYIASHADQPRWAIAGRNAGKLEALGLGVPVLIADATDRASLDAVAARTQVVCTTVGPFAKHGDALVAACAEAGTHYCDLTGELQWHYRMIQAHHERATATGAKLVHSCGYDSIPSDLGTWAAQQAFTARYGHPAEQVTGYYGEASGGLSGGTAASGIATAREASESKDVRRVLGNPYALDPDPDAVRPTAPDERSIRWDKTMGMYTAPFFMAQYNTRIVRRGHALAGFPWGPDFRYREVMSAPKGPAGLARAVVITAGLGAIAFAMKRPALREMLAKRVPQPGSGPSEQQRDRGHWKARFLAERGDEKLLFVVGDKDGDPGYKSTSKMLGEAALCLALDALPAGGGCLTPATAMDGKLVERLRRAGLTFEEGALKA